MLAAAPRSKPRAISPRSRRSSPRSTAAAASRHSTRPARPSRGRPHLVPWGSPKSDGANRRPGGDRAPAISGNPRSSEVTRGHPRSPEVTRDHPRSSEVIRGHQRSSEVIRGHQRSSEVIRGHPRSSEVALELIRGGARAPAGRRWPSTGQIGRRPRHGRRCSWPPRAGSSSQGSGNRACSRSGRE